MADNTVRFNTAVKLPVAQSSGAQAETKPAKAEKQKKQGTKKAAKQAAKAAYAKPEKLYFFQLAPSSHGLLRAYTLAMMMHETGKLEAGVSFKLWPGAHVSTHTDSGRLVYDKGSKRYSLSVAGLNFFNDPTTDRNRNAAPFLDAMREAIRTGVKPECYAREMSVHPNY